MKLLSVFLVALSVSLGVVGGKSFQQAGHGLDLIGDDIYGFLANNPRLRPHSHHKHHNGEDDEHHYHYIPDPSDKSEIPYVKTTLLSDAKCKDLDPSTIAKAPTLSTTVTILKDVVAAVIAAFGSQ